MCLAMNPDKLIESSMCILVKSTLLAGKGPTGRTLLMSPAMVASTAIHGHIVDSKGVIRMNPLVISSVSGAIVPITGNDVDADQIVPARFLKEITFDQMGDYLFYDARRLDGVPIQSTH